MTKEVEFFADVGNFADCLFHAEVDTSSEWVGDGYDTRLQHFVDEVRFTGVTLYDDDEGWDFVILNFEPDTLRKAGLHLPTDKFLEQKAINNLPDDNERDYET